MLSILSSLFFKLRHNNVQHYISFRCTTLFWGAPKSLQMVTEAMKLKDTYSLEGKL